jgi:hypothetical protein
MTLLTAAAEQLAAQVSGFFYLCLMATSLSRVLLRPGNRSATLAEVVWRVAEWLLLAVVTVTAASAGS